MPATSANPILDLIASSLIPPQDKDLPTKTLNSDADGTIDLSTLTFEPLVLMVQASGPWHWGDDDCNQANDYYEDAGKTSIPVNGRSVLHVKRATGAGVVTLRIKAIGRD